MNNNENQDIILNFNMKLIDLDNWRNITNKKWNENELREKVMEEFNEFLMTKSIKNEIEEFYDVIQSMLTLLSYSYGEILPVLLENGYKEHYEKLKYRGHKFVEETILK